MLLVYHTFMLANDHLDFELLSTVWDGSPENIFFNTNQFTYEGLTRLGEYLDLLSSPLQV